ncbi:MAG: alpha/beta hydrolase [Spirochaetes bacterium]|nr:alpha/beta hydrolase [Spirochaetota bacterium]
MRTIIHLLNWFFGIFFVIFAFFNAFTGNLLPAIPLFGIALLLMPSARKFIHKKTGRSLHVLLRGLSIFILLLIFLFLIFIGMGMKKSIYRSESIKNKLYKIYDTKMIKWPVPYETRYIDTEYGKVHVIISGPEKAPAVVLFHASALTAWSWIHNIKNLASRYRTYAIDTLGDANKSQLMNGGKYPMDRKGISTLYTQVFNKLGIKKAKIIGASYGGYIGMSLALNAPGRVKKLVLVGPMGLSPETEKTAIKIMLITLFPIKPLQELMCFWSLGDDPKIVAETGLWFREIIKGVTPKLCPPLTIEEEQLKNIRSPVLVILGKNDNLVGDPIIARQRAHHIPDVRIEVLNTSHAIFLEKPEKFNRLTGKFLK